MDKLKKCERCRNGRHDYIPASEGASRHVEHKCAFNMPQFPIENEGECTHYDSRFIEYPLTIEGIDNHFDKKGLQSMYECGKLVRVSPCGDEYGGKTYLGILLGDLPIGAFVAFNMESKKLTISPSTNPAIFVPELKKIVYGCESWWGIINSPEELKSITDDEIQNTWYVRLLNDMVGKDDPNA